MINKKNLWFLTLFSLVLVLSVYYVTMPSELLVTTNGDNIKETTKSEDEEDNVKVDISESSVISALKVEDESQVLEEINTLKKTLTNFDVTTEEKNVAFEKLKTINTNSGIEETIEAKLKKELSLETFVKIKDDQVRVVVGSADHSTKLANNIMNIVQKEFDSKMYISVQFQS